MEDRSYSNGAGDSSAVTPASKYGLPQEIKDSQVTSFRLV